MRFVDLSLYLPLLALPVPLNKRLRMELLAQLVNTLRRCETPSLKVISGNMKPSKPFEIRYLTRLLDSDLQPERVAAIIRIRELTELSNTILANHPAAQDRFLTNLYTDELKITIKVPKKVLYEAVKGGQDAITRCDIDRWDIPKV
jgi:hypothetical protein